MYIGHYDDDDDRKVNGNECEDESFFFGGTCSVIQPAHCQREYPMTSSLRASRTDLPNTTPCAARTIGRRACWSRGNDSTSIHGIRM